MADAFQVQVGEEFANGLTTQYGFDTRPIQPGHHWGTRLLEETTPVKFTQAMQADLADPQVLLRLYLADVVLGNADRTSEGNILVVDAEGGTDIIPIDQSESFGYLHRGRNDESFRETFNRLGISWLEGTRLTVLNHGSEVVEASFALIEGMRYRAGSFVASCPDEWFTSAQVNPHLLEEYLDHRMGNLEVMADKTHWLGIATLTEGLTDEQLIT